MSYQVGITTDPEVSRGHWESRHPDLSEWREMGPYNSMKDALEQGESLADVLECAAPESADWEDGPFWHVFMFCR